jgi:osmotically-inducible protein OsmY
MLCQWSGCGRIFGMESSDSVIKSDVVEALSRDSRFSLARITVRVDQGLVVLSGDAPNLYTIQVAMEVTGCVNGVHGVRSELSVLSPMKKPDDELVRKNADQILRWSASIGDGKVEVHVESGLLTLDGEVDAYWKRRRAEALMLDVRGVVAVVNNIEVVPDLEPQDQVIAEDVKSAIERCSCVSRDTIVVDVHHGLVTLSGQVPTLSSKRQTPCLAEAVLGVKGVIDKLEVCQPA